jgi:2-polyprenyl-6-hydroxyphenyl methylase/3-demethylubiquinone-9 3-methyltransferase
MTSYQIAQRRSPVDETRFAFGRNWQSFLRVLDEPRIQAATTSLAGMLERDDLTGLRFLDAGCGSGLFSLAARRLGANVISFDVDRDSVACTRELRRRYFPDDEGWDVLSGSALDPTFLATLGAFDVVYSWGVLHHTGAMWRALDVIRGAVRPGGQLFIAIYNDQGAWSRRWTAIKRRYCESTAWRAAIVGTFVPYWVLRGFASDVLWLRNPLRRYTEYRGARGMSVWHDWIDWLGGYPFEVARPEQILDFYRARGLTLTRMSTAGGSVGCNEFVFQR